MPTPSEIEDGAADRAERAWDEHRDACSRCAAAVDTCQDDCCDTGNTLWAAFLREIVTKGPRGVVARTTQALHAHQTSHPHGTCGAECPMGEGFRALHQRALESLHKAENVPIR